MTRWPHDQEQEMDNKPLAHTIKAACQVSGLGRTTIYAALKAGSLSARKSGRRTLILAHDLEDFLNKLPPARGPSTSKNCGG
jgi:excisionase family DNA binding protein